MNPKYPIYIVSKGRWDRRLTMRSLDRLNIPYRVVVEESEYDNYAQNVPENRLLVLPWSYKENYELCDDFGLTKGTGPGPARNFCWDHSIQEGHERHWVMDDNIGGFSRYNRNFEIKLSSGTMFRALEDFVDRYENIAIAGPQYDFFVVTRWKWPAYAVNTRVYSCMLIKNDIPYRWRGRYNEDTDICLRVLKDGWVTVQFNCLVQEKARTQTIKGGNTAEFYEKEGTLNKSKMLVDLHPDVAKLKYRYDRWHHTVNYMPFKWNQMKRKEGIEIKDGVNEYGMQAFYVDKAGNPIRPVDWEDEWHRDPGVLK